MIGKSEVLKITVKNFDESMLSMVEAVKKTRREIRGEGPVIRMSWRA